MASSKQDQQVAGATADDLTIDAAQDDQWLSAQHSAVLLYLQARQVPFLQVPDWPEWDCPPYLALWAAEDPADPGYVGHWVLAGDSSGSQAQPVPFDHLSAAELAEPRAALAAFAKRWQQLAAGAAKGIAWQGSPQPAQPTLALQGQQLARQAQLLAQLAADDELWQED